MPIWANRCNLTAHRVATVAGCAATPNMPVRGLTSGNSKSAKTKWQTTLGQSMRAVFNRLTVVTINSVKTHSDLSRSRLWLYQQPRHSSVWRG